MNLAEKLNVSRQAVFPFADGLKSHAEKIRKIFLRDPFFFAKRS